MDTTTAAAIAALSTLVMAVHAEDAPPADLGRVRQLISQNRIAEAAASAQQLSEEDKAKGVDIVNDKKAEEFWSNFGIALILNVDTGDNKPVKSASVVNGRVVTTEEDDVKVGLGLEVHKFLFGTTWGDQGVAGKYSGGIAVGPYIAVLPNTNEIIDAVGAGVLLGFHGGPGDKATMNIGIGGYIDPKTQVLADGFRDGEAPPNGETSVRFTSITQYGLQAVLSFGYEF